jgi:hypothetical protein
MPGSYSHHAHSVEPRDRGLRVGDLERDAIAEVLKDEHVAGRLDTDELQERVDRCYAATTYFDLDKLVADLPAQELLREPRRLWRRRGLALVALVALIIVAVALTRGHLLWLAIPLFFFVARPMVWRPGYGRRSVCAIHTSRT